MNVELQSEVEFQNEENAHFDSKISTHERDAKLPTRDVHNDPDAQRPNIETRTKPRLFKYVRRYHPIEQIIGDKEARPMTRNRLRNESCLFRNIEPKTITDALQDDDWCKAMEKRQSQQRRTKLGLQFQVQQIRM